VALNSVQEGASDFAQKFVGQAKEDFDNIKKIVSVGGNKLGDILQNLQVNNLFI
jgi:ADP-ribosylation factor GTPase-activating protein 2/3